MNTILKIITLFITLLFTLLISDGNSINDAFEKVVERSEYLREIIN